MKDSCITVMAMALLSLLSGFFFFGRQGRRQGKGHVSVTRETAELGGAGVNKELPPKSGIGLRNTGPRDLGRRKWGMGKEKK